MAPYDDGDMQRAEKRAEQRTREAEIKRQDEARRAEQEQRREN